MAATLIRNASVVDGSESPRYTADVLIRDGVIAAIGAGDRRPDSPRTDAVIDADGLVLSPGFIDMHAHSDLRILIEQDHLSRINQGFTTEIIGQDGLSYAPVDDTILPELRRKIAGWNGNPDDFDFSWRSVGEYLDRLDSGIATNVGYLVPHGTVRALVAGWDDTPLTEDQIDRMCQVVRQAMEEGAIGLSTGLTYTPAMYASTHELERLCRVVAEQGGYFCPHTRSYGKGALDAFREMIEISRTTGCPVELTHATLNFSENAGRAAELLAMIDAALADGVDVGLDTYPYLPGSTTLSAVLPSWSSAGGVDATLARLQDPDALVRLREDLEVNGSDGCHGVVAEWDTIEISGVLHPELERYVGSTIQQIAQAEHADPFDVFVSILVRDRLGTGILQHVGHEENVQAIMRHPRHTVCTDGLLTGTKPHPRAWGTATEYLARYRRDLGIFSLEEMIGHLTGRAARRLHLRNRGLVREGYAADLVLFDPATVAPGATYADPRRASTGVEYVFVNGTAALAGGRRTDALTGRALRGRRGVVG